MKRILALALALIISCSFFSPAFSATADVGASFNEVEVLEDLGLITNYKANSDVTRQMLKNTLQAIYGADVLGIYFKDTHDMSQPLLYGQLLMILVDITGYSPFIDEFKLDRNDPKSYSTVALRIGMTDGSTGEFDKPVRMEEYCKILYNSLTKVDILETSFSASGQNYHIEKGSNILNTVMGLDTICGVLGGVGKTSFYTTGSHADNEIAVDAVWYRHSLEKNLIGYLGYNVEVIYDRKNEEIRSVVPVGKNRVETIMAADITSDGTDILKITYYNENNKKKSYRISGDADFIYNFRLLQSYTKEDLLIDDCVYKLIDNNSDSAIDVIIAEKYDTFMVSSVIADEERIIDKKSNVYEFEDYFENDGKIYNAAGVRIDLSDIGEYNIVSAAKDHSDSEYTNFIVSSHKESGILTDIREKRRFVNISGEEYEALSGYYKNLSTYDKINIGDEVEVYFDFKGYIADIQCIDQSASVGWFMGASGGVFGDVSFKLLNEDGEIEILETASYVTLDGNKTAETQIKENGSLFSGGEFIPQLILYKASAKGIFRMDTAVYNSGIGNWSSSEFSLDYDWSKGSALRAISLNGQKVLGSKYMTTAETKVFGVSDDLDECYVQTGSALPEKSSLKCKLYNVDENYIPAYIVLDLSLGLGGWVDVWEQTYVVDSVAYAYDEEDEESKYMLYYHDGDGNAFNMFLRSGDLKTPNGNTLSGDIRLRNVSAKELKKGSVIQISADVYGIKSISIQAMPMADDSEYIFEKSNSVSGSEYGISEYMFNGSSIMSYGKVAKRTSGGIIINSHLPTAVEEAGGAVFPMQNWNRVIPLYAADRVWFYYKDSDSLRLGSASEITDGDMIFMHRRATTIMTTVVYR